MAQEVLLDELDGVGLGLQHALDERRRVDVVGDGLDPGEPLGADHLFGVERAVGAAELRVALVRHVRPCGRSTA